MADEPSADQTASKRHARGARTAGRALALQYIYSYEQNRYDASANLVPLSDQSAVDLEGQTLAKTLFDAFCTQRAAVDAAIDKRLVNWTLSRLSVIDRTIMRLGAVEVLYVTETPTKVAINEAIELAKLYGSEGNTARLVNGVLDRIARDHRTANPDSQKAKSKSKNKNKNKGKAQEAANGEGTGKPTPSAAPTGGSQEAPVSEVKPS